MADNSSLGAAKNAKNDEFYTQYSDIEAEMNAYVEFNPDVFRGKTVLLPCDDPETSNFTKYFASNFERFGLKKLISTSYAKGAANKQLSFFEMMSPLYDAEKHDAHGKLFTLTRDFDGSGLIDTDDIEFSGYLEGDGDFRSAEVTKLRDEADIIITNPPFSLFREFLAWIMGGSKQFAIIGNQNAITYKEVFPLLKDNKVWLGYSIHSGDRKFNVPDDYPLEAATCGFDPDGRKFIRVKGVRWFTNIDHGGRHEPLMLDTMVHNLKYNKSLRKKLLNDFGKIEYPHYDNYDAIEVPFTECIPSDYCACWVNCNKAEKCEWANRKGLDTEASALCEMACSGIVGVPITFLDKYNPEQFELIKFRKGNDDKDLTYTAEIIDNTSDRQTDRQLVLHHTSEFLSDRKSSGLMGVPITFFDKYSPEQFEIVGSFNNSNQNKKSVEGYVKSKDTPTIINGEEKLWNGPVVGKIPIYKRIIIRLKKG